MALEIPLPSLTEVRDMTDEQLAELKNDLQEWYDQASQKMVDATAEWAPLADIFYVINDRIGKTA